MSRNDVVMTPLRVKQAIDSRFTKPSETELNVLINGTWVEFTIVLPLVVDCAELRTMYKGDTTLIETPVINATGCTSMYEMFKGCTNLKTVKYIHTPNVTNIRSAFEGCSSLTSIPELDTSNVTNMYRTFYNCSSLTSIPELDTSNVTDMYNMFRGCSSLTSIPELDTSSATTMASAFRDCSSLTTIPALNLDGVNNVDFVSYTFQGCLSLTSVTFTGNTVPLYGYMMFRNTPIASGNGYIFVPDNMVNAYKTAEGWSAHASVIKGISEKEALQSNIDMFNMQIEENPTMFAMTEEELEMMSDMEEDPLTGMEK